MHAVDTIKTAAECGVNVVVGTTGFSDEQMALIKESIEENNIKAVICSKHGSRRECIL